MFSWVLLSLFFKEIPLVHANSADTDQTPCPVASELGLHFANYLLGSRNKNGLKLQKGDNPMNVIINVTDKMDKHMSMANLLGRPCQSEADITTYYFIVTFSTGLSIIV